MIIYLPAPVSRATRSEDRHLRPQNWSWTQRTCVRRRATIPEDQPRKGVRTGYPPSVLSCTAWGFSCLANYFASGELLPRHFTLACSETREANQLPYIAKEPAVSFL